MWKQIVSGFILLLVITIITGLIYPVVITCVAQAWMPFQANGSVAVKGGNIFGSTLIGQKFESPAYFHGRPSLAGTGYDGVNSGGSNFGPTSKKLFAFAADNLKSVRTQNRLDVTDEVPSDLVFASASGLDPDISPAAAYIQAERVAVSRNLETSRVVNLIESRVKARQLGLFGQPRVNVLELNLALDELNP